VVVICVDGCAGEYLALGFAHGELPRLAKLAANGHFGQARGALPSFTNVNNCAMVTGTPPSQTGIGGNYILDPDTGEEVMTNSSRFLRNDTILAAASAAGRKVAMVTAKDKLRELLSKGMDGIALSAEKADDVSLEVNGIDDVESLAGPKPSIYSGEASLYTLRVGVELLAAGRADFLYLSLTDYMQHKYAPEAPESREFYRGIDTEVGRLLDLGAIVGITADHGMNAKCNADGEPNVIFLETELTREFGDGCRVICPITDPYVVHHGALGSAVTVYLPDNLNRETVAHWIAALDRRTRRHHRGAYARGGRGQARAAGRPDRRLVRPLRPRLGDRPHAGASRPRKTRGHAPLARRPLRGDGAVPHLRAAQREVRCLGQGRPAKLRHF